MKASGLAARHVGCPTCGATLGVREGERTVRCEHCEAASVVVLGDHVPRFRFVRRVSAKAADAAVRRALFAAPVPADLTRRARFDPPELYWAPFSELEALQAGMILRRMGQEKVRGGVIQHDADGNITYVDHEGNPISQAQYYQQHTREKLDTHVVLRNHYKTEPAVDLPSWGLDRIDIQARRQREDAEIVPWDALEVAREGGFALPPERTAAEILTPVDPSKRGLTSVQQAEYAMLAPELRFVFYPIWTVRYEVGRHPYKLVVDGVTGEVLAGRGPEAPRRGALIATLLAAYLGLPLGKLVATVAGADQSTTRQLGAALVAMMHPMVLPFAVVGLLALLLPLAIAWGEFRYRGEVAFGPDGVSVVKLARPERTVLEKAVDAILEKVTSGFEHALQNQRGETWR